MTGMMDRFRPKSLSGKVLLLVLAPLAVVFLASWLLLVPTLESAFLESRKEYL